MPEVLQWGVGDTSPFTDEARALADCVPVALVACDASGIVKFANDEAARIFGYEVREFVGQPVEFLVPENLRALHREHRRGVRLAPARLTRFDRTMHGRRKDGSEVALRVTLSPLPSRDGPLVVASLVDATEHEHDVLERQRLEKQLAQAHKLEALGHLAAGIAHEINSPTQYVSDNVAFLSRAFPRLSDSLAWLRLELERAPPSEAARATLERVHQNKTDYLLEQVPAALDQAREGLDRLATIVDSIKTFAHPSAGRRSAVDLARAAQVCVMVARNEWKHVAEIETHFDEDLPTVCCLRDEISQVIVNLVVNAAHAIEAVVEPGTKGTITLAARRRNGWAELAVSDTGKGIAKEAMPLLFEPFYTTKAPGKGTGRGLHIVREIVVENHGGELLVDSEVGHGTTFTMRLPLDP